MRSRRWVTTTLVAVAVVTLSGCWPGPGGGPDRRSANDVEDDLTVANVSTLERAFEIDLPVEVVPDFGVSRNSSLLERPLLPKAPVVTARGLFLSSAEHAHGFDRTTGEERWRTRVDATANDEDTIIWGGVGPGFVIDNDHVVVGYRMLQRQVDGTWGAFVGRAVMDVDTGEKVLPPENPYAPWPPILLLVNTTEIQGIRGGSAIGYLNPIEGSDETDTTVSVTRASSFRTEARHPGLTLGGSHAWVAAPGYVEAAVHPNCGFPCEPFLRIGVEGTAHPVVLDNDTNTGFVATTAGELHAIDPDTRELRWTAQLGSPAVTSPAHASDGTLYVATEAGEVVAVDGNACDAEPDSCAPSWRGATSAGAMTVQPAVGGGVVYTGSEDGSLHAFDAGGCDGVPVCDPVWSDRPFDAPLDGGLAIAYGHLYAGRASGVVAYRPTG